MRPIWCYNVFSIKPSASKKLERPCVCCWLLCTRRHAFAIILPMHKPYIQNASDSMNACVSNGCIAWKCGILKCSLRWDSRHLSGRYWKSCPSKLPSLSVSITVPFHLLLSRIQTCLYAFLPCFTVSSSFIWSYETSASLQIFRRPLLTMV